MNFLIAILRQELLKSIPNLKFINKNVQRQ